MTYIRYPEGHVLLRHLNRDYPVIDYGDGIYLFDTNKKRYIDASSGAMVVSIGHGNQEVSQKIITQMNRCAYVNGLQFTSEVTEQLALSLTQRAPQGLNRAFFLNSGSEAIEAAIKLARQVCVEKKQPSRYKIITRNPGYHGNTLYALSASARGHYKKFFGPLLHEVITVQAPYSYRCGFEHYETQGAQYYAQALEKTILEQGPDNIAAFLCEPVIGSSAGAAVPPSGYFKAVTQVCQRYGILMIADEVLCGTGRTGRFFASEHFDFTPDILVLGKGLSAGYIPLSAVLVNQSLVDIIKQGSGQLMHAQTFLQTPSMCAAGLAVIEYIDQHQLVQNAQDTGHYLIQQLHQVIAPKAYVGCTQGIGLLAGVELVADKTTKQPFSRTQKIAEKLTQHCFDNGLIVWPNTGQAEGEQGDLIMIAPPLIITRAQVDELIHKLACCIDSFFAT